MKFECDTLCKEGGQWRNEDTLRIVEDNENNRWLGVVSGGMGGHKNGDIASQKVADAVAIYWLAHAEEEGVTLAKNACKAASAALDKVVKEKRLPRMGTTMVIASVHDRVVTVAHLGDSR